MFDLNEEQAVLSAVLRRFVADRYDPRQRESYAAQPNGFDGAAWQELASLGLNWLTLPAYVDGLSAGVVELSVAMEALGPALLVDPWLQALVVSKLIVTLGSPGQKDRWLADIASGKKVIGLALREPGLDFPLTNIAAFEADGKLNGCKVAALGQGVDAWLILAKTSDEPALYLVAPDALGLSTRKFRLADGSAACDLVLTDCAAEFLGAGRDVIEDVLAQACIALCAEAVGIMDEAVRQTIEYLHLRVQFDVPLASFQVIQHRMADCAAELELGRSLAMGAAHAADNHALVREQRLVVAFVAMAYIIRVSRHLAEEMVQFHGAIGITEELWIGRALKRLLVIGGLFGDERAHTAYAERFRTVAADQSGVDVIDADPAFREEVRSFLAAKLPKRLSARTRHTPGFIPNKEDWLEWQAILHREGWLAYNWPESVGGLGWSPTQQYVFERECALAFAPTLAAQGLRMLAPVLAKFGTDEQKARFLPRILTGEHVWCQGYSEPEAGTDLASLKTSAIRDGDDYIVNGTKIWTTYGHFANWMFCLVRTDPSVKKQSGISFLLIDMNTPGVEVKPIRLLSGDPDLNQVFFDNVRVSAENLVGAENDGWTIAKFLLEHERGGAAQAPGLVAALLDLRLMAASASGRDGKALARDSDFMHRLAMLQAEAQAMEILEQRLLMQMAAGSSPGPRTAIIGLVMANVSQAIDALALEAHGAAALELECHARPVATDTQRVMPAYLNNRAWSIMAGSNEVMRAIIAKSVLRM